MFNAIIIAFRETLEMLVVLVALAAYAKKLNREDLVKYLLFGSLLGLASSIIVGGLIFWQAAALAGTAKEIFQGSMMIILSMFILYYMVWMNQQKNFTDIDFDNKYKVRTTAIGFVVFSAITVFRECTEVIMFVLPTINLNPLLIAIGCTIGMILAVLLMVLIYKAAIKISLNVIFTILTLILIFVGALMFGEGLEMLLPASDSEIQIAGSLVFAIPTIFIFLKKKLKSYIKK